MPTLTQIENFIELEYKSGAHDYQPIPVVIEKGKGVYLWDIEGKKYYDFLSAYSAVSQGHCHPRLIKILHDQSNKLTLTSRAFFNDQLGSFMKKLCQYSGMEMACPMNTGAEAVETALKIESNNYKAIFQLGNILLIEKNYSEAIKLFNQSVKIKPDFWQAINNKGLAYFEKNNINLAINLFEKAISIEENAEPLLGLASCLRMKNINLALQLTKKALNKDPNYVSYDYRKEQLWGEKLQASTEILLQNDQLQADVILAKAKINESS